jgi:glycerophosphoryl diester phosphodiesterase
VSPALQLPRVIAHRGAPRQAPENTLVSFRRAHQLGARWVEFDVALTADARPVIFHDDALDRTSDGQGLLAATEFETVKQLDAGSWFGRPYSGEPVPTLEEALDLFIDLGLAINMELKTDPGREAELAAVALAIAREMWPADRHPPLISSFSRTAIEAARPLAPEWPMDLIYDHVPGHWLEDGKALGLAAFGANQKHLTRDQVMSIRGAGFKLSSYTVNDVDRAAVLFQWGVDAIFTDVPDEMVRKFGAN